MSVWGRILRDFLKEGQIEVYLSFCYVDDIRLIISLLSRFITWDVDKKRWRDSRIEDQRVNEEPPEKENKKKHMISWNKDRRRYERKEILEDEGYRTNDEEEDEINRGIAGSKPDNMARSLGRPGEYEEKLQESPTKVELTRPPG